LVCDRFPVGGDLHWKFFPCVGVGPRRNQILFSSLPLRKSAYSVGSSFSFHNPTRRDDGGRLALLVYCSCHVAFGRQLRCCTFARNMDVSGYSAGLLSQLRNRYCKGDVRLRSILRDATSAASSNFHLVPLSDEQSNYGSWHVSRRRDAICYLLREPLGLIWCVAAAACGPKLLPLRFVVRSPRKVEANSGNQTLASSLGGFHSPHGTPNRLSVQFTIRAQELPVPWQNSCGRPTRSVSGARLFVERIRRQGVNLVAQYPSARTVLEA